MVDPHFLECLRIAVQDVGAENFRAIAHSMGARLLVNAFARQMSGLASIPVRQIVLPTADIDAGVCRQLASSLRSGAERVTLCASENDRALLASRLLQEYLRAGDAGGCPNHNTWPMRQPWLEWWPVRASQCASFH